MTRLFALLCAFAAAPALAATVAPFAAPEDLGIFAPEVARAVAAALDRAGVDGAGVSVTGRIEALDRERVRLRASALGHNVVVEGALEQIDDLAATLGQRLALALPATARHAIAPAEDKRSGRLAAPVLVPIPRAGGDRAPDRAALEPGVARAPPRPGALPAATRSTDPATTRSATAAELPPTIPPPAAAPPAAATPPPAAATTPPAAPAAPVAAPAPLAPLRAPDVAPGAAPIAPAPAPAATVFVPPPPPWTRGRQGARPGLPYGVPVARAVLHSIGAPDGCATGAWSTLAAREVLERHLRVHVLLSPTCGFVRPDVAALGAERAGARIVVMAAFETLRLDPGPNGQLQPVARLRVIVLRDGQTALDRSLDLQGRPTPVPDPSRAAYDLVSAGFTHLAGELQGALADGR